MNVCGEKKTIKTTIVFFGAITKMLFCLFIWFCNGATEKRDMKMRERKMQDGTRNHLGIGLCNKIFLMSTVLYVFHIAKKV